MLSTLKRLFRQECGDDLEEYALLLALIAFLVVLAIHSLGKQSTSKFNQAQQTLSSASSGSGQGTGGAAGGGGGGGGTGQNSGGSGQGGDQGGASSGGGTGGQGGGGGGAGGQQPPNTPLGSSSSGTNK
jgi:Flp pilus assembly pilin Flp